jgi:hypothetical protein
MQIATVTDLVADAKIVQDKDGSVRILAKGYRVFLRIGDAEYRRNILEWFSQELGAGLSRRVENSAFPENLARSGGGESVSQIDYIIECSGVWVHASAYFNAPMAPNGTGWSKLIDDLEYMLGSLSVKVWEPPNVADPKVRDFTALITELRSELTKWQERSESEAEGRDLSGRQACTSDDIAEAERRLGAALPDEVIEFYRIVDGLGPMPHPVYSIAPLCDLEWLVRAEPDFIRIIDETGGDEYGDWYDDQVVSVKRSLLLSKDVDAGYLLLDIEGGGRVGTWTSWNPGMEWHSDDLYGWLSSLLEELPYVNTTI